MAENRILDIGEQALSAIADARRSVSEADVLVSGVTQQFRRAGAVERRRRRSRHAANEGILTVLLKPVA